LEGERDGDGEKGGRGEENERAGSKRASERMRRLKEGGEEERRRNGEVQSGGWIKSPSLVARKWQFLGVDKY
jgi:hypothetical protein